MDFINKTKIYILKMSQYLNCKIGKINNTHTQFGTSLQTVIKYTCGFCVLELSENRTGEVAQWQRCLTT